MLPWIFSRKGASGFSWASTADHVTAGISAAGLVAVVTGASSGIGAETARVLAARGAHVVMAARNLAAAETVRQAVLAEIPAASVDVMELDLSSLASVRSFAADFAARGLPLNILINNAGVMATPFSLSKDGIEMQFATNHVGHFLLTHLLLETMKKTSRESNMEGRIVNVSSEGHRFAYKEGIRFAKLNDEEEYSTIAAYGQSKLANILHANELARRFKEEGVNITANSLHPGSIITNLLRHHSIIDVLHRTLGKLVLKNAKQVQRCTACGGPELHCTWSARGLRRSAMWRCTRTPRGCRASTGATATCTSRARRPKTRSWARSSGTTPSTSSPDDC